MLLRTILLIIIAWIAVRMVRTFMKIMQSSRDSGIEERKGPDSGHPAKPEDFPHGDIKDAEFIDLNAPDEPTHPPKAP